jgi:hypothetical protein
VENTGAHQISENIHLKRSDTIPCVSKFHIYFSCVCARAKNLKIALLPLLLLISVFGIAQDGLFNRLGRAEGMQTDRVYDLQRDRSGRLWFAGANGVYLLRGEGFKRIAPEDLFEAQILGLSVDPKNRLWCYTSEGKIYLLNNNSWQGFALNTELSKLLQGRIINTLQFDSLGKAWISTVFGGMLLNVDPELVTLNKVEFQSTQPHSQFVRRLGKDAYIWGSAGSGRHAEQVLACDIDQQTLRMYLSGKGAFGKSVFIALSDQTFLFGLDNELIQFDVDKIIARRFVEKPIECLYEDYEGKIWVGLNNGGLLLFPTGSISETGNIEYLGNKSVTAIHEDLNGRLWACTSTDGIYYYNQGLSISYKQPDIIKELEEGEEVQAIYSEQNTALRSESFMRPDTIPPSIAFTGFQINGRDTSLTDGIKLEPDKNFIKFYFVGSSPSNPGVFQYKYKMHGADKDYVYTSSNYAQYTTLPPGKYSFEVSAMNKEGIWSLQPIVIKFEIKPHFYQTAWFLLMCLLVALGLVVLMVYAWSRRYKRKQMRRAALEKHIASVELAALRAQMNPHFIFNTLSSIQYFVSSNNTEEALRYLSKFASLMRVILNNSRKKVVPLKDELKAIQLYLDLEKLRFKQKFDFAIDVDPEIDTEYETVPGMLIQPFVENAILHGIMHKETSGFISVKLHKTPGFLVCEVEDDGIGRQRASEIKATERKDHVSQGMSITRDRLEIINRVNNSRLSAVIEDLADEAGNAAGTRVKIFIPIDHE